MNAFFEWLDRNLLAIALSFVGGMVFAARSRERTLYGWFCCTLTGTFSGVVTNMILEAYFPLPANGRIALASAAASFGGLVLDTILKRLADKAGEEIKLTPKPD